MITTGWFIITAVKILTPKQIKSLKCGAYHFCPRSSYDEYSEYQLLIRAISKHTKSDDNGNLTLMSVHEGIDSKYHEESCRPDATYWKKADTKYRGYIANVVEMADNDHNGITVDYQYEKNTYSDRQFFKDYMEQQSEDDHMPYSQQIVDTVEYITVCWYKKRTWRW